MGKAIRRRRRRAPAWRELLELQAKSGLSVEAFCRREDLNRGSFYVWRSRLRRNGGCEDRPIKAHEPPRPGGGFIDLGSLSSGGSRCEVRLEFGGGLVLSVVRG